MRKTKLPKRINSGSGKTLEEGSFQPGTLVQCRTRLLRCPVAPPQRLPQPGKWRRTKRSLVLHTIASRLLAVYSSKSYEGRLEVCVKGREDLQGSLNKNFSQIDELGPGDRLESDRSVPKQANHTAGMDTYQETHGH